MPSYLASVYDTFLLLLNTPIVDDPARSVRAPPAPVPLKTIYRPAAQSTSPYPLQTRKIMMESQVSETSSSPSSQLSSRSTDNSSSQ